MTTDTGYRWHDCPVCSGTGTVAGHTEEEVCSGCRGHRGWRYRPLRRDDLAALSARNDARHPDGMRMDLAASTERRIVMAHRTIPGQRVTLRAIGVAEDGELLMELDGIHGGRGERGTPTGGSNGSSTEPASAA